MREEEQATRMKDSDLGGKSDGEKQSGQKDGSKTGGRRSGKRGRRTGKGSSEDMSKRGGNDPRWHSYSPELTRLAADLPFGTATGVRFNTNNPIYALPEATPGICAIGLRPSVGNAVDQNSALNIGANKLYSSLRTQLAGTFGFDAPDCMIYGLALTSIYSAIVYLQRIYGVHKRFDQMNRYISDALLTANHVNADDVRHNSAQLLFNINQMLARVASYNAPAFIDIFAYHAWLYRDIYIEGTSIKEQLYLYVPDGFWFFNLNPEDKAGMLEFKRMDAFLENKPEGYLLTVEDLTTYVNNMIDRLWFSEDFTTISSFMLKAYGSNNMIKVSEVPADFMTSIELNEYVLHQFKNATVLPAEMAYQPGAGNVYQDPTHLFLMSNNAWEVDLSSIPTAAGAMRNGLYAAAAIYPLQEDKILSEDDALPTPEMVIESTRHMITIAGLQDGGNYSDYNTSGKMSGKIKFNIISGSTIPVYVNYLTYVPDPSGLGSTLVTVRGQYAYVAGSDETLAVSSTGVENWLIQYNQVIDIASKFKYHPCHTLYITTLTMPNSNTGNPTTWNFSRRMRNYEINNMTVVDFDEINNLHDVALLSELDVPTANFKSSSNSPKK